MRALLLYWASRGKGSNGSIWHVHQAVGEWPVFARTCRPGADVSRIILAIFDLSGSAGAKSHLCLLRQLQGVLHLDAEISEGALKLGMAQQKLHSAQVLGPPIDQRGLGPADGMGSVRGRIKTNFLNPGIHNPSILPDLTGVRLVLSSLT